MSDDAMFGYFGDELEHVEIDGRDVNCIPIYNFFALRLQYIEKQTTRLQALTYEQIIFDFWDNQLNSCTSFIFYSLRYVKILSKSILSN